MKPRQKASETQGARTLVLNCNFLIKKQGKTRRIWIAGATVGVSLLIISCMTCFIMLRRKQKERDFSFLTQHLCCDHAFYPCA
ncbi:G-type lectin S-receptor serine/threonine-protein kinase CES10 [Spatholobus suberectus]|nr:G-type lectin S-receptor serine/threonine-protein kinase CES10 [Spatholobus suberectus]